MYPDKREYDGEWKNDLPHGFGRFNFANTSGIIIYNNHIILLNLTYI